LRGKLFRGACRHATPHRQSVSHHLNEDLERCSLCGSNHTADDVILILPLSADRLRKEKEAECEGGEGC
jgi:hypothetical protein